jgi:DNA polymerase-4
VILHVDMDAFYAAIELRERPELAGKPIIVGADPRGRGVVSTCSYEARKFGVHSAMPISEAYRRCPQGVYLPVRMELYVAASHQVMEVLRRFTPLVEPLSIDEAFLDVAGCEGLFGPPETIARRIKKEILAETKLSCSVGVAPNKFLAKLATELGKPDGLTVIAPDRIAETLDPLPVTRVFGVGKRTAEALAALGIHTVGQIARAPTEMLRAHFGDASTQHIQSLARGEDDRRVEPHRLPQQVGSERTFDRDVTDARLMRRQLLELSGLVGMELRRHGYRARTVRLKLRTEDFATITRSRTLTPPTDSDRAIYRTILELFAKSLPKLPVRLLGVTGADLVHGPDEQATLFGPPEDVQKVARVERAMDKVREKFGRTALKPASLVARPRGKRSDS